MVDNGDEGPPSKMVHSQFCLVLDYFKGSGIDSVDSSLFMPSIGEYGDLASRSDPRLLKIIDSLQEAIAGDGNEDDIKTSTEI